MFSGTGGETWGEYKGFTGSRHEAVRGTSDQSTTEKDDPVHQM